MSILKNGSISGLSGVVMMFNHFFFRRFSQELGSYQDYKNEEKIDKCRI